MCHLRKCFSFGRAEVPLHPSEITGSRDRKKNPAVVLNPILVIFLKHCHPEPVWRRTSRDDRNLKCPFLAFRPASPIWPSNEQGSVRPKSQHRAIKSDTLREVLRQNRLRMTKFYVAAERKTSKRQFFYLIEAVDF